MGDRSRDVLQVQPANPDVTDHVLLIPVHQIELGERLRPVDRMWAEALGQLMQAEGQLTPIEVCRLPGKANYTVVSGGHRRIGAELAGLAYLKAIVVTSERAERRMREISENLWRKGLDPLDRAAFVGDMHDLLRARAGIEPSQSPQSIAAQARWQKTIKEEADDATAMIADAYSISAQVGERLGLSERTIRNDLTLRRRLSASEIARLREIDHPVLRNAAQLLALAKLEEKERSATIGLLVDGKAQNVGEAVALRSRKPKPKPEDKLLSAFIGAFSRMSLPEKKGALVQLAGILTPVLVEALGEAIDLPGKAPSAGPDLHLAIVALRKSSAVLGYLADGSIAVTDDMIAEAYDACEQAFHGCGPAISNDEGIEA